MTGIRRPLTGTVVNISISESDDNEKRGYPSWQVNRITLQLTAALFGQGSSLIFGHDWREDGVMEAIHGFASQVVGPIPLSPKDAENEAQPLLRNFLPWPDRPFLSERDLERLSSTLRVETVDLPPELADFAGDREPLNRNHATYRYLRARGLTSLRHRLTKVCNARVCIGGRQAGAQGRYPGVIEEALLAVREGKPLYLTGLLGGATEQVIEAFEGKQIPASFCPPSPVSMLYLDPPIGENSADTRADRVFDRTNIWDEFATAGLQWLTSVNGLTAEENSALLHTYAIDQVIELVLTGMSRVRASKDRSIEH